MSASKSVTKTIGVNLCTIAEFAELRNIHRTTVTRHVLNGSLPVVIVGKHEHVFIDAKKHANYSFDESKTNNRYKD